MRLPIADSFEPATLSPASEPSAKAVIAFALLRRMLVLDQTEQLDYPSDLPVQPVAGQLLPGQVGRPATVAPVVTRRVRGVAGEQETPRRGHVAHIQA